MVDLPQLCESGPHGLPASSDIPSPTGKACVLKTICIAEMQDVAHGADTCEVVHEINT